MPKKEDFLRYYSRLSTAELLKILEERQDYEPAAIEVAQQVLSERKITDNELVTAREELNVQFNKQREQQEKMNKRIEKIGDLIDENFGVREKTPKKLLNLFSVAIFLFYLIGGLSDIKLFAGLFNSKVVGFIVGIVIYLLQLLIIYLLYKRTHSGWVLFVGLNVWLSLQNILAFYFVFTYDTGFFYDSPYNLLPSLCFHLGVIIFLNVKSIHEQFQISKDKRATTIIVSGIIAATIIFILGIL